MGVWAIPNTYIFSPSCRIQSSCFHKSCADLNPITKCKQNRTKEEGAAENILSESILVSTIVVQTLKTDYKIWFRSDKKVLWTFVLKNADFFSIWILLQLDLSQCLFLNILILKIFIIWKYHTQYAAIFSGMPKLYKFDSFEAVL